MSPLQSSPAPVESRGTQRNSFVHAAARKQRGIAMFVLLVALGLLVGLLAFGFADDQVRKNERQQRTTDALAQTKDALIGWSVQRAFSGAPPNARPGELPCPDINPLDGFEDGSCAAGAVGRVPWKTLGIPEPKDGADETLWYAIAGPFRIWSLNGTRIDNDTKGNLTAYFGSTTTTITTEAVAVVFAPGASLGAQIRDAALALCPTTGTTIARKLCAANYLDATGGANNATTNGPYISAQASNTFNDKLLVITTDSLMTPVEQRAAREMLTLLQSYKTASAASGCNCYPWAAGMDEPFDDDSVDGRTRGGVPIENALPHNWGDPGFPVPPSWMIGTNIWGKKFYYAVAPAETATHTAGTLTVNGVSRNLVLLTPGPAGASRPSTNLPDYLEDLENRNNDNIFCRPGPSAVAPCTPTTAYARDRLYTIP